MLSSYHQMMSMRGIRSDEESSNTLDRSEALFTSGNYRGVVWQCWYIAFHLHLSHIDMAKYYRTLFED